ncbi:MAG: hypothetical protein ACUVX8_01565 [Candidatus Zipacnadales bacterium]
MEVLFVSAVTTEARPGEIVTASVRVTNYTAAEEEFIESLELPLGWVSVITPTSFSLRSGESLARIISIAIPRTAMAGAHEICYGVRSQRDPAIQDSDRVTIGVLAVQGLEILLVEAPSTVLGGDSYVARFQVVNCGNSAAQARLEALSSHGYSAHVAPTQVTLEPGATADVTVTVATKPDLTGRIRHSLQLVARLGPEAEGDKLAAASALVDVIPRVRVRFDAHHRIPARLTVSAMGNFERFGAQCELVGSGSLAEDGEQEVDFLLRGPDTHQAGLFGERDEFRLGLATPAYDLKLGDQTYTQSRLTDPGMYGRGAEVAWRLNDTFSVGAYRAVDRWGNRDLGQIGGHISARFGAHTHLRLNYLQRRQDDPLHAEDIDDTLSSVEAEIQPCDNLHVAAEYAWDERCGAHPTKDDAYRVEVDGSWRRQAYYSLSSIHAGPDYYGAFRDCDYLRGALTIPLSNRLQTHLSWNTLRLNLQSQPDDRPGTDERMWRVGARYSWSKNLSTTIEYEDLNYCDPLQHRSFDRRERGVHLGLLSSGKRLSLRGDLTVGTQYDRRLATSRSVAYYGVYAAYRLGEEGLLTVYGAGGGGEPTEARLLVPSRNFGASALWAISDRLRVQTNYTAYGKGQLPSQLDLQAVYGDPQETNWTLRLRLAGESQSVFILSWSRPLQLPGERKTSVGGLRGRVFDAQTAGEIGVPNVILSLGELTAATDAHGWFSFGNVPIGEYPLVVDSASIGLSHVPTQPLPIVVNIEPGRAQEVRIGITEAGRLSGRVMRRGEATTHPEEGYVTGGPGTELPPAEPEAVAGILVELTNGTEVLRRVTDVHGEFLFDRLRPGQYQFRAYPQNLPPFHVFENPEAVLDIAAGETVEMEIHVIPQKRRIQMIDATEESEVIRLTEPSEAPATSAPPADSCPETWKRGNQTLLPHLPTPGDLRENTSSSPAASSRRVLTPEDVLGRASLTITAR